MMSERLTFTRRASGNFELSEEALTPAVRAMKAGNGLLTKLDEDLVDAAQTELVRLARAAQIERNATFDQAAGYVMCVRPHLLYVAQCQKTREGGDAKIVDTAAA